MLYTEAQGKMWDDLDTEPPGRWDWVWQLLALVAFVGWFVCLGAVFG